MTKNVFSPGRTRESVEAQSRPFHAYSGSGPYIFISYAHRSADRLYPVINDLYLKGYNVWYDQGIPNFADLQDEIFKHIEGCSYFVMFASAKSLESPYVRLEIEHAFSCAKKMICVELKPVDLSVADPELLRMLSGCVFVEPDGLRGQLPGSVRETESRDPDVFQVDGAGFEIKLLKDFEFHLENGKVVIDKYLGRQTEVAVPAAHDLFPIFRLGTGAFEGNGAVVQIKLPDGLNEIGKSAFSGCKKLKSVNIPGTVRSIGDYPFAGCESLKTEGLLDDFRYYDDREYPIRESVYLRERGGISVEPPREDGGSLPLPPQGEKFAFVNAVRDTAESMLPSLRQLYHKGYNLLLSEDAGEIENASLIITFMTQASFGNAAFRERLELSLAGEIPLFPVALEKNIAYPEEFRPYFEKKFILHREDLTDADYTYMLESELIGRECRGETRDAEYAANKMLHPDFEYVIGDAQVTLTGVRREASGTLEIPGKIFGMPVTRIENGFLQNGEIEALILPEGLAEIGQRAFYSCPKLHHVFLPGSLRTIGGFAFSRCVSLTEVTLPNSVVSVGENAFAGCEELAELTLSDGLRQIQDGVFSNCLKLRTVTIPKGVTEIGWYAFKNCAQLTRAVIPQGVQEIKRSVFYNCTALREITLPRGLRKIGSEAFALCSALSAIELSDGLTEIGEIAFACCKQLSDIAIPKTVTQISAGAFEDCISLRSVVIPDGVRELSERVFLRCSGLSAVTLPAKLRRIGSNSFQGCKNLSSVTVPGSVAEIGENAFADCGRHFTIAGSRLSLAYDYAKRNKLKFIQI